MAMRFQSTHIVCQKFCYGRQHIEYKRCIRTMVNKDSIVSNGRCVHCTLYRDQVSLPRANRSLSKRRSEEFTPTELCSTKLNRETIDL